jgi:membrane-associated phospholipid phosphatase
LRASDWLIVGYLGYLVALVPFRPIPRRIRLRLLALAPVLAAAEVLAVHLPVSPAAGALRTWIPLPYIILCYWLTGFYFVNPQPEYEARFVAFDRWFRERVGAADFARSAPRLVLEYLEASYFSCYVVLPAGMAAFILAGQAHAEDRLWTTVLLAELACYGVLPWIRTRPPWSLQPDSALTERHVSIRRLNLMLVHNASTQANTFPSGHAAGAVATALAVAPVWPAAGVVFFVVAISIMAGSIAGEYHYAGDAVTGAATAVAAWGIVSLMGV